MAEEHLLWTTCDKRERILGATEHCLVLGGPGSGKTTLALKKATRLIADGMPASSAVLFLSFSKAAVARIADASQGELEGTDTSRFSIQTFHSFFWQILQGHGYLLGSPRSLVVLPTYEEAAKREGMKNDDPNWNEWVAKRQALFRDEGKVSFDLFAPLTLELLQRCERLSRRYSQRYPVIIVDEAQDTNEDQWQVIRLLAHHSQVICLADPDQMIYGHLPGVSADRVPSIRRALAPCEVNLGSENNRSPGTDIARLARDVFHGTVGSHPYVGVTMAPFRADSASRDKAIRSSTARLREIIRRETGEVPESIAILTSYGSGAATVSAALQQERTIPHHVLFDESFVLLCARTLAYLLEPKPHVIPMDEVATLLELCATAYSARGKATHRSNAAKLRTYAIQIASGRQLSFKPVVAAKAVLERVIAQSWTGLPRKDWLTAKQILRTSGDDLLSAMANGLDYVVAFGRGNRINEALSELWLTGGTYAGARGALDLALAQDHLLSGQESLRGTHVMNVHKAKGKQFDGVVLLRLEHGSPFVWRGEGAPYEQGRRLLHMALTRARKHVLIVHQVFPQCPILKMHRLI